MTDLEIVDYLLSIPNVDYFVLVNIGNSDIWIDYDTNLTKHIPALGVRYANPVSYTTSRFTTGFKLGSVNEIANHLQERIINLIYPFMVAVEAEEIINIYAPATTDNIRYFLSYRITYAELNHIRRKFQIDDILISV